MLDRDVSFVTTFESARFRLVTTPSMSACVIAPCSSNPETRRQTLRDGTLQGIDDGALCSQCHGGSGQGHARGGRGNRSCCGAGRPRHRRMLCHQVRADGRMLHRLRLQRLGRRQHVPHPQLVPFSCCVLPYSRGPPGSGWASAKRDSHIFKIDAQSGTLGCYMGSSMCCLCTRI